MLLFLDFCESKRFFLCLVFNVFFTIFSFCEASFSKLCGAERSSLLKRVTFLYFGFVFTFSPFTFSISRTHGTEKEKAQPDWRK